MLIENNAPPNYTPQPPSRNRLPQANHSPHTGGDSRLVIGGYILFKHIAQQGQDVFYLCAAPVRFPAVVQDSSNYANLAHPSPARQANFALCGFG